MKSLQELDSILRKYTHKYIRNNTDMYSGAIQIQAEELRILIEYAWMYKEVSK